MFFQGLFVEYSSCSLQSAGKNFVDFDPIIFEGDGYQVAKAQVGANAIRAVNGRSYQIGSSSKLLCKFSEKGMIALSNRSFYPSDVASGGSEDWTAGVLNITYSYCLELPPVGGTGFIVPTSEIKKTGKSMCIDENSAALFNDRSISGDETYKGVVAYLKTF